MGTPFFSVHGDATAENYHTVTHPLPNRSRFCSDTLYESFLKLSMPLARIQRRLYGVAILFISI
jgi:hypothetical protein